MTFSTSVTIENDLTIDGTDVSSGNSEPSLSLGSDLKLGRNLTDNNSGGGLNPGGNKVTFQPIAGVTAQIDGSNLEFDALTIDGDGTVEPQTSFTANGTLLISDGSTLDFGGISNSVDANGLIDNSGTLTLSSNSGGGITLSENFKNDGTINANSRTITFDSGASQHIRGGVTPSFGDITLSNGTTLTLRQSISAHTVTIGGSSTLDLLDDGNSQGGNLTLSGNLVNDNSFLADEQKVILNGGSAQSLQGSSDYLGDDGRFYDLEINNSSGGVSLDAAAEIENILTLTQGDLATNSNLRLESINGSPPEDAGIVHSGGTLTSGSNEVVERLVPGSSGDNGNSSSGTVGGQAGWRMMSPPFVNSPLGGDGDNSDGNTSGIDAGEIIELGDGQPLVQDLPGAGGSGDNQSNDMIFRWDATGAVWEGPSANGTDPQKFDLDHGKGFLLYFFDDDKDPINDDGLMAEAEGTLPDFNGDVTVSIDDQDAFHLLGNPYPSRYDLTALDLGSDFSNVVSVYDYSQGGYFTVDYTKSSENANNNLVGPWQGFFVERTGGSSTDVTFPRSGTTSDNNAQFYKAGPKVSSPPQFQVMLRKVVDGSGIAGPGQQTEAVDPGIHFEFRDGATEGYDSRDVEQLIMPTSMTARNGDPLALEKALLAAKGTRNGDTVYKMRESAPTPSSYPVTFDVQFDCANLEADPTTFVVATTEPQGMSDNWIVRLKDTHADSTVAIYAGEGTSVEDEHYKFDVSKSDCGSSLNKSQTRAANDSSSPLVYDGALSGNASTKAATGSRFELVITPEEIPPVELNGFNGAVEQKDVVLEWETNNETNNDGFYVQHRREGSTKDDAFEDLTFIESKIEDGVSERSFSYRHRVEDLDVGTHTFRLKQVDVDGHTSLSEKIDVKVGLSGQHLLTAYPNPLHDQATVEFAVKERRSVTLELYNTLGQRVKTLHQDTVPAEETQRLTLDATSLSSGLYVLRLRGDGFSINETVTVVH